MSPAGLIFRKHRFCFFHWRVEFIAGGASKDDLGGHP